MGDQIILMILSVVATGVISSAGTVVALRVHIDYLRDGVRRAEGSATRAHARIDELKKAVNC